MDERDKSSGGTGADRFRQLSVLTAVHEMTEARCRANIVPDHVLLLPLRERMVKEGMTTREVLAALTELRNKGKIKIGRTINDWYIVQLQ